jgi:hypothetical protein
MSSPVQSIPPLYAAAIHAISDDRFGPYMRKATNDTNKALELYHWNMRVSAALYESLHIVEVALRNAIDRQLSVWNQTQVNRTTGQPRSADWLLDPAPMLARVVQQDKIDDATRRARDHIQRRRVVGAARPDPKHCDVLAQLMFGTWRFLIKAPVGRQPDSGAVLLWRDVLPAAFPSMTRAPSALVTDVVRIYGARNRIAHLEPMLDSGMVLEIRDSVDRVLGDIDTMLPYWFNNQETVSNVLGKHPTDPIPSNPAVP